MGVVVMVFKKVCIEWNHSVTSVNHLLYFTSINFPLNNQWNYYWLHLSPTQSNIFSPIQWMVTRFQLTQSPTQCFTYQITYILKRSTNPFLWLPAHCAHPPVINSLNQSSSSCKRKTVSRESLCSSTSLLCILL